MRTLHFSALLLALAVPACDFGRDNAVDASRPMPIDAALMVPDADLDAPGLDAPVPVADHAVAVVPPDANGG